MFRIPSFLAACFLFGAASAQGAGGFVSPKDATQFDAHAVTVLVFLYTDCPVANVMAPELARIGEEYREKDVVLYRVYADATLSERDIVQHGKDFKLTFPAVRDEHLDLVKLTGAQITPEAVVYDQSGARRYRGRINNRYEELGKPRREATQHDLRAALDAVLSGKPVPNPETKAVGCYLPKPDEAAGTGSVTKEPSDHESTPKP